LSFYAANGNDFIGNSQPASSVFISTTTSDNRVRLNWQYAVPWSNFQFAIYRYNTTTTVWDSIGMAISTNTFLDSNLENEKQYCYYVDANGSYYNAMLPPVLYNRSQRVCATPQDLTPPCAPTLIVNSDCYEGMNQLAWTNPMHENCGTDDVVNYTIYFSPTEGGTMNIETIINSSDDTSMIFQNLFSVAGCYSVTASDTFNNQSVMSNVVCIDNCPDYELPNVFTPNGDNINDEFIPFPYRDIKDVDIKIYDRWGTLVFQTTDPDIHWNGLDMNTNKLCVDGVYYYTAKVDEIHLSGIVPRELKGFVHLFGKNAEEQH